ncbi:hypothetical protein AAE478_002177 [Parahypoxylon ruwenzoriense]
MEPIKFSLDAFTLTSFRSRDSKKRVSMSTRPSSTTPTTRTTSSIVNYPDVLPGGFQPGKKSMLI